MKLKRASTASSRNIRLNSSESKWQLSHPRVNWKDGTDSICSSQQCKCMFPSLGNRVPLVWPCSDHLTVAFNNASRLRVCSFPWACGCCHLRKPRLHGCKELHLASARAQQRLHCQPKTHGFPGRESSSTPVPLLFLSWLLKFLDTPGHTVSTLGTLHFPKKQPSAKQSWENDAWFRSPRTLCQAPTWFESNRCSGTWHFL